MEYRAKKAIEILNTRLAHSIDRRGRAYFIPAPENGTRWAMTDIHGCFQTFVKLLNKINLHTQDQLFILGDMVDRGPYSFLVLDKIWELIVEGYQIFPLRGNHEQLFLDFNREGSSKLSGFAARQYAMHLIQNKNQLPIETDRFFAGLPIYYETEHEFLVHAGFNTEIKDPFTEWKDMLWIRSFDYHKKKLKDKTIIHGHVPVTLSFIEKSIKKNKKVINLDNGCVKAAEDGYGRLVCLNLDSLELVSQKNQDLIPHKENRLLKL